LSSQQIQKASHFLAGAFFVLGEGLSSCAGEKLALLLRPGGQNMRQDSAMY
jgi:hypothetical protein